MVEPKDPKPLTIYTSVEICRHLDRLRATGLFGRSRSAVAAQLLSQKLLEVLSSAQTAGILPAEAGASPEDEA